MFSLRPRQAEIVERALAQKTLAVFAEQRTGKTYISLGVIDALAHQGDLSALVVAFLSNKDTTWRTALQLIEGLTVCHTIEELRAAACPRVLLLHYHQLKKLAKRLKRIPWSIIIADESQAIKDRGSVASRCMRQLRHSAPRKLILSATPIEQAPQDVWAQFRFLDPRVFGDKWADFDEEYLRPTGFMGYKRKFRQNKLKQFIALIEPMSVRLTREESGIQDAEIVDYPVSLAPRARRLYDELRQRLRVTIDGQRIRAPLEITVVGRLHQICGGGLLDERGDYHYTGAEKRRAVQAIIDEEAPGPCVVFCRYRHEVSALEDRLRSRGLVVASLTGEVKDGKRVKRRTELLRSFQAGNLGVLICQIRTGGVGVDLYRAQYAIMYSTTYSYIDIDQAINRICHESKKTSPKVYFLRAPNTIDDDIQAAYLAKEDIVERIMKALR